MVVQNRLKELLAIKERKEYRSITLERCAEESGVNYRTVRRWAKQETTRFDAPIIAALCKYFDCTPGELLIRIEEDEPSPEQKTPLAAA